MGARLKTINAEEGAYEGFRQLAKECELTSPELVAAMVQYFRVTKADPRYPTGPDLTTSLAKITAKLADLDKRTIGFIREQEKTYLKPMLAQVQALQQLSGSPAPAAEGPGALRPAQVHELFGWYARMLRRVIVPGQLTPTFQAETLPPPPAKGQEDPALVPLRNGLFNILRLALHPDILTPAASAPPLTAPAAGAAPPVSSPTRPA
jgi:hypothetical protein